MNRFSEQITGKSPALNQVIHSAQIIASTDAPVLVLGETGTGKDLLARAIHQHSPRQDKAFVSVNCAALPETLVESVLFGHRKGAFTGASDNQAGLVSEAEGGTLFLDEVGELPLTVQAKLLRFLENGECLPLGHSKPVRINTRIIAATNRDLQTEVSNGSFRQDLYYRLHIVPLQLPPLRERREDIKPLVSQLTAQLAEEHDLPAPNYSKEALRQLHQYTWPGNVRELRNLCERMLILFSGMTIEPANLPLESQPQVETQDTDFTLPEQGLDLDTLQASMIRQAIERTSGNRSKAARLLGISRDTLLYRIRKYALD